MIQLGLSNLTGIVIRVSCYIIRCCVDEQKTFLRLQAASTIFSSSKSLIMNKKIIDLKYLWGMKITPGANVP